MMSSLQSEFNRELDRLYQIRTEKLRHIIGDPKIGKAKAFTRNLRNAGIKRLKEIASKACISRCYRKEIQERVEKKKSWHITRGKGFNLDAKQASFKEWYSNTFYNHRICIYIFWSGNKCLYVGKTEKAPGRIISHIYNKKFGRPTRIDVYQTYGKSDLPILECLAMHRYGPKINKMKAAKKRYTAKCPICIHTRNISRELHEIFVL
jgi:hypothetical protein